MNYQEAIKKAEHLKALDQTDVMLRDDDGEFPWHLATQCEPGGSHRFEIATSVWFTGKDPHSGLTFKWTFDLEPYSASGKGTYQIDAKGAREVLMALPKPAARAFQKYLADCAAKVMKQALDYQASADRLYTDANTLTQLSTKRQPATG